MKIGRKNKNTESYILILKGGMVKELQTTIKMSNHFSTSKLKVSFKWFNYSYYINDKRRTFIMSKYENAIKLMEERCGNGKEEVIALATISLSQNGAGNPRPAVRMVCAYYEDGVFYVSTDAQKNKTLQIEKNNEVSVCGFDWYTFQGIAENLGWVKDEKNTEIRAKFKQIFDWFDEVGDEDNPNSIVVRITLTEGTITDNERKYGEHQYEVDFINKTVK